MVKRFQGQVEKRRLVGCYFMLIALVIVLSFVGFMALQKGDRQQVNEATSVDVGRP